MEAAAVFAWLLNINTALISELSLGNSSSAPMFIYEAGLEIEPGSAVISGGLVEVSRECWYYLGRGGVRGHRQAPMLGDSLRHQACPYFQTKLSISKFPVLPVIF